MKAAIIGGGVIGGGWAARFLLHGWDVAIFDPSPDTPKRIEEILANARKSLPALADVPMPVEGTVSYADSVEDAVADADWIQESVSENLELKHKVLASVQSAARDEAIVGSSTSGFKPSELQEGSSNPSQILVAHPFNPVYLLPLAEVVAGPEGDDATGPGGDETSSPSDSNTTIKTTEKLLKYKDLEIEIQHMWRMTTTLSH